MFAVKGLAWDDKPDEYMILLRRQLESYHINLEIERDHGAFLAEFDNNLYDFVVLDLFKEGGTQHRAVGQNLAEAVARKVHEKPWYPIFVVTGFLERLVPENFEALPPGAMLRYKADPVFLAQLIKEDLVRRGVFTSRQKVFLIRCVTQTAAEGVKTWLGSPPRRLQVVEVTPGTLSTELTGGLLKKMNECAAIVAVCTPDEQLASGNWRTRPNVILEIGMALGLYRGLERLIIFKQENVERPSDISGVLTLDYQESPNEKFVQLEQRLAGIGVDLQGSFAENTLP